MTYIIAFRNMDTDRFEFSNRIDGDFIYRDKDRALKQFKLELQKRGADNIRLITLVDFEVSMDIRLV